MRILMMLLPLDGTTSEENGFGMLERFLVSFYFFRDRGATVVLASPDGGAPWTSLRRRQEPDSAPLQRFNGDREAREELGDALRLEQIYAEDFDGASCFGIVGSVWRKPSAAGDLVATLLAAGKPVVAYPSSLDLSPHGAGSGLLILADHASASFVSARALLGALSS